MQDNAFDDLTGVDSNSGRRARPHVADGSCRLLTMRVRDSHHKKETDLKQVQEKCAHTTFKLRSF
jgi:hypothetical protein